MIKDAFMDRHIGPTAEEKAKMLKVIGVKTMEELIEKTIPAAIRMPKPIDLPEGETEGEYLAEVRELLERNKIFKSYIGMGYYATYVPPVIMRNVFENPGWYTAYTPYQAEISQGRLEALLNYQTMISSLTGMPIANASMLDAATAAGEMMLMFYNSRSREAVKNNVNKYFVSEDVFVHTLAVLKTNAEPLGIELVVGKPIKSNWTTPISVLRFSIQSTWAIHDFSNLRKRSRKIFVGVDAYLLSLTLLTPPGEWGADCVTELRNGLVFQMVRKFRCRLFRL